MLVIKTNTSKGKTHVLKFIKSFILKKIWKEHCVFKCKGRTRTNCTFVFMNLRKLTDRFPDCPFWLFARPIKMNQYSLDVLWNLPFKRQNVIWYLPFKRQNIKLQTDCKRPHKSFPWHFCITVMIAYTEKYA